jgi:hypothetical protein
MTVTKINNEVNVFSCAVSKSNKLRTESIYFQFGKTYLQSHGEMS